MSKRIVLKFAHPLSTPGASLLSRALISAAHLNFALFAGLLFLHGKITAFLPLGIVLMLLEILHKNQDAKPYLKELYLRAALHIMIIFCLFLIGFMPNGLILENIQKAISMLVLMLFFLNLFEATQSIRGKMPIRTVNKNNART